MLKAAVDAGATIVSFSVWDGPRRIAGGDLRNPQRDIGADVQSRLDAIRAGRAPEMRAALATALVGRVAHALHAAGRRVSEITAWCVSGSVAMQAIMAGRNPEPPPGADPLSPPWKGVLRIPAAQAGLHGAPMAEVAFLPPLASFAGGDTASALASLSAKKASPPFLLLDAGTCAEIAYCAPDGTIWIAGLPAGAVFEAAGISCGVSPFRGAIDRAETAGSGALRCHVAGDPPHVWALPGSGWINNANKARGVCAAGLADVLAESLKTGVLSPDGSLPPGHAAIPLRDDRMLTRDDIKLYLKTKAEVCAAIETLLDAAGARDAAETPFYIAGSSRFGISPGNAAALGLWPDFADVRPAGNASLAGAEDMARVPRDCEARLYGILQRVRRVNVRNSPGFAELAERRKTFARVPCP